MDNWTTDLKWSARAFSDLVWPILNETMPGKLVHVEAITRSDFARDLDQSSGIDAWHIHNSRVRGLASRVQVCPRLRRRDGRLFEPYNTFTVRRSRDSGTVTEYEKRKQAIESHDGWLYPHLAVQAYITSKENGELRSFGVARTRDIIASITAWIDAGEPRGRGQPVWTNRTYNASFFVVRWDHVAQYTYTPEDEPGFEINPVGLVPERLSV